MTTVCWLLQRRPPPHQPDGYNLTIDNKEEKEYLPADLTENPTLAEMTRAALLVLEQAIDGFWLLVEAGDADGPIMPITPTTRLARYSVATMPFERHGLGR